MFCTFILALSEVYMQWPVLLFVYFLDFMLSCYNVQVLSEWFWDSFSCPCFYWYHFCFYVPRTLNFYYEVFIFQNLLCFSLYHISVSWEIATSVNTYVPFSLLWIVISSLLLWDVRLVCTCWFPNKVTVPSQLVSTSFGTWSSQCSLSNFTPIFLHVLKHSWAHSIMYLYVVLLPLLGMLIQCTLLSHQIVDIVCICYLFLFVDIFVAWYFVCNAWSCVAIPLLSVSPFRSLLDSHRSMFPSLISCLSIFLIYWPCITSSLIFALRTLLILLVCVECLPFVCNYSHLIYLILLQLMLLF